MSVPFISSHREMFCGRKRTRLHQMIAAFRQLSRMQVVTSVSGDLWAGVSSSKGKGKERACLEHLACHSLHSVSSGGGVFG